LELVVESAETAGDCQAEAVEKQTLGFVRLRDAAETHLSLRASTRRAGGQHHVAALELGHFFDQRPRCVA
jgi:hypothetical protein